jgi:hypothetical protein
MELFDGQHVDGTRFIFQIPLRAKSAQWLLPQ